MKKRLENDCGNWVMFQDVHDPVIDRTVWEQMVLGEIQRLTKSASQYEDLFTRAVMGHSQQSAEESFRLHFPKK